MSMFCYQCQETVKGTGCTVRGVCGKTEDVAKLQDLLIYTIKGVSEIVVEGKIDIKELDELNYQFLNSLFMTITNANFDEESIENQIKRMFVLRDRLRENTQLENLHDASTFVVESKEQMLLKASSVGVLATVNEDIRSLRELIIYGLKGMAAYAEHAWNLGKKNFDVLSFMYEALAATLDSHHRPLFKTSRHKLLKYHYPCLYQRTKLPP